MTFLQTLSTAMERPIDDRAVAQMREEFNENFSRKRLYSNLSTLLVVGGAVGFGKAIYSAFKSPLLALGYAVAGAALVKLWTMTRNQEGYALQSALSEKEQPKIIEKLSLGANIHGKVWFYGGAAPALASFVKGGSWSVLEWFADEGFTQVIAYLALLEPNDDKRASMATKALQSAKDIKTAQLLIDLGGKPTENKKILYTCCINGNLELLKFYIQAGVKLDAGIDNYVTWQEDYNSRERQFGGNWYPGNSEGVSPNLHPTFRTPLEMMLYLDKESPLKLTDVIEAMVPDPSTINQNSAEELYHSLNKAGVRIRRQFADVLFEKLKPPSTV